MCKHFPSVYAGFGNPPSVSVKEGAPKAHIEALRAREKGLSRPFGRGVEVRAENASQLRKMRKLPDGKVARVATKSVDEGSCGEGFSGDDMFVGSYLCHVPPVFTKGGGPRKVRALPDCRIGNGSSILRPSAGGAPAPP